MKKSKLALLAGVAGFNAFSLLHVAHLLMRQKGRLTTTCMVQTLIPLNYLTSNRATTSDITTNLVDGLFENDQYGNLSACSCRRLVRFKDGLTYTTSFEKMRSGMIQKEMNTLTSLHKIS